ncbi:ATP-binding protein [Pectinatus sottacetonis]|uniref:ATP-binding protein n=1 Tax=Pectinatus sottacetonis TaxID=1002795 RepID=UPI0038B3AE7C
MATAASELSTNILRYATTGEIILRIISTAETIGIEIIASDKGPGIPDIKMALKDNFTTTNKSLGMGLPSVKRIMDDFIIDSHLGKGTYILTRKWK